jgi:hypothetical protein
MSENCRWEACGYHKNITRPRRVGGPLSDSRAMIAAMAQPHKGQRKLIMCRPVEEVYEEVKAEAAQRGISMSQLVADVLAYRYDREDLVRELHKHPEVLPLAM